MTFEPLTWSQDRLGTWNGKVRGITMFCVSFHTGGRGWFVAPKLPGLKTVDVPTAEHGRGLAHKIYQEWLRGLMQLCS